MSASRTQLFSLVSVGVILFLLVGLGVRQYEWNVSSLLRIDHTFGTTYEVPNGTILYTNGGYDGMLYYQVARNIPHVFFGDQERTIPFYKNAYRYQRILLPLLSYVLAGGKDAILPFSILGLNILASIGALFFMLRLSGRINIHAFTVVGNPAVLIGILFSLTEPINLFFVTLFLYLFERNERRVDLFQVCILTLALFSRETTLFLLLMLIGYLGFVKRWREVLLSCIPLAPFILWQLFLFLRFGEFPISTGSGMFALPLSGLLYLFYDGILNPSPYRLSSMSFAFLFVIPLSFYLSRAWRKGFQQSLPVILLLGFLLLMLSLDAHIWGVITSVGRVLPPLYPLYALIAMERNTWFEKALSFALIAISIVTAIGVAATPHPYLVS